MKREFKKTKKFLIVFSSFIFILVITTFAYMQQPKFGASPSEDTLKIRKKSTNFRDGKFQNQTITPTFAEGYSFWGEIRKELFERYPRTVPLDVIPSVKSDLKHLSEKDNVIVWFGHSSCFIKLNGKTILIDPVLSGSASPVPWSVKSFKGTDIYTVDDLPAIDYLLISHDHYDHLDYETVKALEKKTKHVICGLGVGAHFERWGYAKDKLIEKDWNEKVTIDSALSIYTFPSRHKSGRGLKQDRTLWISYLIEATAMKIYYSGDGGYDTRFAAIGKQFGPIDIAIVENGQYDEAWHYIHMLPGETLKAASDLKAKRVFPVHNSKFKLARHPWDEPLKKITELNEQYHFPLITPMIGEVVNLNDSLQVFKQWWKDIK